MNSNRRIAYICTYSRGFSNFVISTNSRTGARIFSNLLLLLVKALLLFFFQVFLLKFLSFSKYENFGDDRTSTYIFLMESL